MRLSRRVLTVALVGGLISTPLRAQSDSLRIARLTALGRLFGVVKYFHPAFLDRDVSWDSAVVVAIDAVGAARSADEYRTAVVKLLGVLDDPATRVSTRKESQVTSAGGATAPSQRWMVSGKDSTLVIAIPDFDNYVAAIQLLNSAAADVRRAPGLVFDLRSTEPEELGNSSFVFANSIQSSLSTTEISAPAQRLRMHSGFVPQLGGTSGGYWSGSYTRDGGMIRGSSNNRPRRIVFLVTPETDIPEVAFALRNAGQGSIVAEGADAQLRAGSETYDVQMGEGITATVRLGEVVGPAGADTVVSRTATGGGDAALDVAIALTKRPVTPPLSPPVPSAHVPAADDAYPGMRSPSVAYRILAAYRYWNAIHYFYPYKRLIGEDWTSVLPRSIRMLEAARDSLELAMALATMVTYTHDSHSGVIRNTPLIAYFGVLPTALQLQYIGGQPVVIRVGDDSATKASGIVAGDVVVKVDGEDVVARRARMAKFIAYSTPQALDNAVAQRLLRGTDSVATLIVRGRDNRDRGLVLPRRQRFDRLMQYPRSGPVLQLLPGNVGYADLSLLTPAVVDSMFELFKNTKGIIFDDRGYPQGTAWSIAPRLSAAPVPAAAFQRPLVMSPDSAAWTTYNFIQSTPPGTKWVYHGKTILLVDERTISQAEHTGLFLEAANGTTIVGSPTMGANGDVTTVALVAGMYATFTGHDVRHADGRQLQRVGLQPDVVVRPTLAGIRAGRDEVLERALAILKK